MNRNLQDVKHGDVSRSVKQVPASVVVGRYGHSVTRGYTEIGGIRFYDDMVVVGSRGERVVDPGSVEQVQAVSAPYRPIVATGRRSF
jgi:hypothetical protein|nr:hypothetical protein [Neorhizobium tomejilense]